MYKMIDHNILKKLVGQHVIVENENFKLNGILEFDNRFSVNFPVEPYVMFDNIDVVGIIKLEPNSITEPGVYICLDKKTFEEYFYIYEHEQF